MAAPPSPSPLVTPKDLLQGLLVLLLLTAALSYRIKKATREAGLDLLNPSGDRPITSEDAGAVEWWRGLQQCRHRSLILPPDCVQKEERQPGRLKRVRDAVNKVRTASLAPLLQPHVSSAGSMSETETDFQSGTEGEGDGSVASHLEGDAGPRLGRYRLVQDSLPEGSTPLIVFVNSKSGGNAGGWLLHQFRRMLNPIQVVDLARKQPKKILAAWSRLPQARILVCGGDGTVGWILNTVAELQRETGLIRPPPIAVLPLGTGNDLARCLGWGGGYKDESLRDVLRQVQESHVGLLDRWCLRVDEVRGRGRKPNTVKDTVFNNYFGVGVDAQACLAFHNKRERSPELFISQFVNKMWYTVLGAQDIIARSCSDLSKTVKIIADGKEVEIPDGIEGIIVQNIQSYAGGLRLWNDGGDDDDKGSSPGAALGAGLLTSLNSASSLLSLPQDASLTETGAAGGLRRRTGAGGQEGGARGGGERKTGDGSGSGDDTDNVWAPSSMQDGMLEVMGVYGALHIGQLHIGVGRAVKLCQCRDLKLECGRDFPMQIDGEPWGQKRANVHIRHTGQQAYMLHRTLSASGELVKEMVKILDWAEATQVITPNQRHVLVTEVSRSKEPATGLARSGASSATLSSAK